MSAKRITENKVVTTTVAVEKIQLTLTLQEAKTMACLVASITGSDTHSRRKHCDDISAYLSAAGVDYDGVLMRKVMVESASRISFKDEVGFDA